MNPKKRRRFTLRSFFALALAALSGCCSHAIDAQLLDEGVSLLVEAVDEGAIGELDDAERDGAHAVAAQLHKHIRELAE